MEQPFDAAPGLCTAAGRDITASVKQAVDSKTTPPHRNVAVSHNEAQNCSGQWDETRKNVKNSAEVSKAPLTTVNVTHF